MVVVLASACSPPAVVLQGARRLRVRPAGARGPAWRSRSTVSPQIRGGGGSGGRKPVLDELRSSLLRRIRRRPWQSGVGMPGGRLPRLFIVKNSVAARRRGTAASLKGLNVPRQRKGGGRRSSSPSPAVLRCSVPALVSPLRIFLFVLSLYYVLCTWFGGEFTWLFGCVKKKSHNSLLDRHKVPLHSHLLATWKIW